MRISDWSSDVCASDLGTSLDDATSDDAFWGTKIDWQVNDNNLLELLAFSDENTEVTEVYDFDLATGSRGEFKQHEFGDSGGLNWSATWTTYLPDNSEDDRVGKESVSPCRSRGS